jgi:hypothetical protein
MEGCYKDLRNHKKKHALGHKHFRIPQNCCHKIIIFAFQKLNKMCTPNLRINCELWGDLKSLELERLLNYSKKSTKDEDFYVTNIFGPK